MKKILNMICHPRVGGNLLAILFVFLAACTDYVQQIDERNWEWNDGVSPISPSSVVTGEMTDFRDNQTYKTVKIGDQVWMAQNLNYETANSYCYDGYASCSKYGRLYTWAAAMDSVGTWSANGKGCGFTSKCSSTNPVRGVCPEGWHLPDTTEWKTLFTAVGGSCTAGKMLKSASGWKNSGNGSDAYAFSALLAGYRHSNGNYYLMDEYANFWNSTEEIGVGRGYAYIMEMSNWDDRASLGVNYKNYGLSVRCVKDDGETAKSSSSVTPPSSSSATSVSSSSIKSSSSTIVSSSSEKAESSSSVTPPSSSSETSVSSSSIKSSSSMVPEPEGGVLTDSRDGQTYKTVTIGTQIWMAENLNYAYTGVPYNYSGYTSDSTSWCYSDAAANCTKYGRLYTWSAAMDSVGTWSANGKGCGYNKTCSPTYPVRGVCPEGWHLPTQTEWNTLFTAVGGRSTAGKMLKSTSGWYSSGNGTDAYSFSALPAGFRHYGGDYYGEGSSAYFWSSTEYNSNDAYDMGLYYDYDYASLDYNNKNFGISVRCVKDDGETAKSSSSVTPPSSSSETSVSSSSVTEEYVKPSAVVKGTMTDSRDHKTYKTVTIGTQTWMAENLNYAYTGVPYNYSGYTSDSTSWCYSDAAANCTKYGRLYTWAAAMDSVGTWATNGKGCGYNKTCSPTYPVRGVCPEGWHLPTQTEWDTLFTAVGGQSTAGKMLKSTSGWYSSGNGTDAYSFSALPAGGRNDDGLYYYEGNDANFWSSTELNSGSAYYMGLYYGNDYAYQDNYSGKYYGFSVRCVKD